MTIARDEIFGPVVSVLPFNSFNEVPERANKTHYGLAAAVWTKDIDKAHLYAKRVKAGTVWVNCYPRRGYDDPLRRFQAVRSRTRERRGGLGALHRVEDGHRPSSAASGCWPQQSRRQTAAVDKHNVPPVKT